MLLVRGRIESPLIKSYPEQRLRAGINIVVASRAHLDVDGSVSLVGRDLCTNDF